MGTRLTALGVGCRKGASPDALLDLVEQVLLDAGIALSDVSALGTITGKQGEPAVQALSARLDLSVTTFSPERLEQETPRLLSPSDLVFRETGCHGVAEAAALAMIGGNARLVMPKRIGEGCTVAVALFVDEDDNGQRP